MGFRKNMNSLTPQESSVNEGAPLLSFPHGPNGNNNNNNNSYTNGDFSSDPASKYHHHAIAWEFPGWGSVSKLNLPHIEPVQQHHQHHEELPPKKGCLPCIPAKSQQKKAEHHSLLGQWAATSVAGNDITSSCLYTAGLCALEAGKYSPISLMIVAFVLYLFRNIYAEVGTALPLNGGAYNVLLNSTSKLIAAIAACLTLVSYIATAVVSASSAIEYGRNLWEGLNPNWAVVALLGFFAFLTLMGLKESAGVALTIFILHLGTMSLLVVACVVRILIDRDMTMLKHNWNTPNDNIPRDIFFGFCSALLGVSGFETSSNYVEEQKPGVFAKTLRNMWVAVTIFNPLLSFLSLFLLSLDNKQMYKNDLLAQMGEKAVGKWLQVLVSADALIVLSGAVLTAFVGITGLVRRMSLDRCLPQFLLAEMPVRKTNYLIIVGFFLVTTALFYMVNGNIGSLAGVYTIAFLGVMSLFALGNMILKYKRGQLHRDVVASWPQVVMGMLFVLAGLAGNIISNLVYVKYFLLYFTVTLCIVMLMFARKKVTKVLIHFTSKFGFLHGTTEKLYELGKRIENQPMVFFCKTDDPSVINKGILYVRDNELTNWLQIVHIYDEEESIPHDMEANVMFLDKQYPKMCIDLVLVKGEFNPQTVRQISEQLQVPRNFMFITCPGDHFPHNFSELGGLRLITH